MIKNLILFVLVLFSLNAFPSGEAHFNGAIFNGSIAGGSTAAADAKSILDLTSVTKGALLPRMTTTQMNAIASPPTGLLVYNTTLGSYRAYNGASWVAAGGELSMSAVGAVPNANGASVSSLAITLQPADATYPGVMTASAQTLAGVKTWANRASFSDALDFALETDSSTTGAAQTVGTTKFLKRLTNASLTSICGVTAPTGNGLIILVNGTGASVTVTNDATATSTNRIITGTGGDLVWKNTSSLWLAYDSTSTRWRIIGGSGGSSAFVFGSTGSPRSVVAATGITSGASHMSTTEMDQVVFVTSSVANATTAVSANPQITAHTVVGARMVLIAASDSDSFSLDTGNGLFLNGLWISLNHNFLKLLWDGTVWAEQGRGF